jgi:hypothetical protein
MRIIPCVVLAAATVAIPLQAQAQSESAFVGWVGLVTTPVGAFTPLVPGSTAAPGTSSIGVQLRYSRWQFDVDDDNTTNIGAGLVVQRGAFRTTIELGQKSTRDCSDCDVLMGGVDVHVALREYRAGETSTLGIAVNPAVGFGKSQDNDFDLTSLAGAISVPVTLSVRAGEAVRVVPFVSPGVGFARLSGDGESETGSRAMMAGGLTVAANNRPVQLTASMRKIFIEDGPMIYGVAFSFGR